MAKWLIALLSVVLLVTVKAAQPNVDTVYSSGVNTGSIFTIAGSNFGSDKSVVTVSISTSQYFGKSSTAACAIIAVNDTTISCTYPAASTGVALGLTVKVGNVVATGVAIFATTVPVQVSAPGQGVSNIAAEAKVSQSSNNQAVNSPATNAVDGDVNTYSSTDSQQRQWFQAILPSVANVRYIGLVNRPSCTDCQAALSTVSVYVSDQIQTPITFDTTPLDALVATGRVTKLTATGPVPSYYWDLKGVPAKWFLVVDLTPNYNVLTMAEFQVFAGCPTGCSTCSYSSLIGGGNGTFSCSCASGYTATVAAGCCPTDLSNYADPEFFCQVPTVLKVGPTSISNTGSVGITVSGFNFGKDATAIKVTTVQGANCTNVVIITSDTTIKCTLSLGGSAPINGRGVHVIVSVGGVTNLDNNLALVYSNCANDGCGAGYYCGAIGSYLGCYTDNINARDLPYNETHQTSINDCVSFCRTVPLSYAGIQFGGQCFCGTSYGFYGKVADSECNYPCQNGNNGQTSAFCGGALKNSVFSLSTGCLAKRANGVYCGSDLSSTCASGYCVDGYCCNQACVADNYRCDTVFNPGNCSVSLPNGAACTSNSSCSSLNCIEGVCCDSLCTDPCSTCVKKDNVGTCTAVDSYQTTSKCIPYVCTYGQCGPSCTDDNLCAPNYKCAAPASVGCFKEDCNNRDLSAFQYDRSNNTQEMCADSCYNSNFQYSGVTSTQCYCGDSYNSSKKVSADNCNLACGGSVTESCGGSSCFDTVLAPRVCVSTSSSTTGAATTGAATTGAATTSQTTNSPLTSTTAATTDVNTDSATQTAAQFLVVVISIFAVLIL